MNSIRKLGVFLIPLAIGILCTAFVPDALGQVQGSSVLSTSVRELNFGLIEVNSNINRVLQFDIINNQRAAINRGTNQVNVANVDINARIESDCNSLTFRPSTVDIPTGGRATIEVTLNRVDTPGPLVCSAVIISDEILVASTTGGRTNNIAGISSPFPAVEITANVSGSRMTLTDFQVRRTARAGVIRNLNQQAVNITSQGGRGAGQLTADFGSLNLFEEIEFEFDVTNTGNANLVVDIRGTNSADVTFARGTGNNINVAPGRDHRVEILIRPVEGGNFNATLTITQQGRNAGRTGRNSVTLRMIGTGNTINIVPSRSFLTFQAQVPFVNAAAATTIDDEPIAGNSLDEPVLEVRAQQNRATDTETLTLRNEGEGDDIATAVVELDINRATGIGFGFRRNTDPFSFQGGGDNIEFVIGQGQTQQVQIVYAPEEPGLDEAVIEVTVRAQNQQAGGRVTTGQVIQKFFINLRGIAIATNQNFRAAGANPLAFNLQGWGMQRNTAEQFEFKIQGEGLATVQAEVLSLSGKTLFDSGAVFGRTIRWNPFSIGTGKETLANGVYLYRLTIRGLDGSVRHTPVQKFVLLR